MNTETMRLVPIMLIDDKSRYITHENDRQDMLAACNEVGECSAETSNGIGFLEGTGDFDGVTNRTNLNNWFDENKKYGSKYRGAGVIQLTWKSNYKGFRKWMKKEFGIDDSNIMNKGAEYVAMNYPWEAAAFFWATNNLNSKADTGDIHQVTSVVNPEMTPYEYNLRKVAYNNWMNKFHIN